MIWLLLLVPVQIFLLYTVLVLRDRIDTQRLRTAQQVKDLNERVDRLNVIRPMRVP